MKFMPELLLISKIQSNFIHSTARLAAADHASKHEKIRNNCAWISISGYMDLGIYEMCRLLIVVLGVKVVLLIDLGFIF